MSTVRKTTRPHTSTVTKSSTDALDKPARARRKPPAALPANKPLVTRIDPAVMKAAKRLAGNDMSRLRMNPDGTVLVVNRGRNA